MKHGLRDNGSEYGLANQSRNAKKGIQRRIAVTRENRAERLKEF